MKNRARSVLLMMFWAAAAGSAAALGAATTPACDEAVRKYDEQFKERSDAAALAAARALDGACAGTDKARAKALSTQGFVLFQRHDIAAAAAAFKRAVQLNPADPVARMNLCGALTEGGRHVEAIGACREGLELAKAQDDGSPAGHEKVLELGFNLALAKVRSTSSACGDHSVFEMFDAYRQAHPEHAWVHQLVGAWVWDCDRNFDKGLALYKKSCALGQQTACEQVKYTESCMCQTRQPEPQR